MAEDSDKAGAEASGKPKQANAQDELPVVESPSISPAEPETAAEPAISEAPSAAIIRFEPAAESSIPPEPSTFRPRRFRLRHKVMAALAASIVVAGAAGVMAGIVASGSFRAVEAPKVDTAAVDERKAMQQSIARLSDEIGKLKTRLELANKTATTQIAKVNARLDREASEITGSISAPQTTAPVTEAVPAPMAAPELVATPLPTPRPIRMAAVESTRPAVVHGWTIHDNRNGFVYVRNRSDIYEVVPGAPLPGLGRVERIQRQNGRWVVVTPRGLIVSPRDRAYFE